MKRYCGLRSGNGTAGSFAEIGSSEGLSTAGSSGEAGPTVDAGVVGTEGQPRRAQLFAPGFDFPFFANSALSAA